MAISSGPDKLGSMTRAFVVDDHAVVRAGLRSLLAEAGVEVVGDAGDAESALEQLGGLDPDVLIVDVNLPGRSGLDALPDLLAAAPGAKAIVLSMQNHPRYARQAFAAGARGYVVKDAFEHELIAGVDAVAGGATYVNPALGARLATEGGPAGTPIALSQREQEILGLVAHGLSNREIGEKLWLSPRTVENHRLRIMRKIGASSRAELIDYALTQGLL
jgi:two-component system, NarL family, response regulator NreC